MNVNISKDCYLKLFTIAKDEALKSKEAAAILYGGANSIDACEKYESDNSNAAVVQWNNQDDLVNILNEIGLRGIFHSHLFASCQPSGVDVDVMQGLTRWAVMMEKPFLYFVIGGFFKYEFNLMVWQMDKNYLYHTYDITWV